MYPKNWVLRALGNSNYSTGFGPWTLRAQLRVQGLRGCCHGSQS